MLISAKTQAVIVSNVSQAPKGTKQPRSHFLLLLKRLAKGNRQMDPVLLLFRIKKFKLEEILNWQENVSEGNLILLKTG